MVSKGKGLSPERQALRDALRELEANALRGRNRTEAISQANRRLQQGGHSPVSTTTVGGWFENGSRARDFEALWAVVTVLYEWSGWRPADTLSGRHRDEAEGRWAGTKKYWKTLWERAGAAQPPGTPPAEDSSAPLARRLNGYLHAAVRAAREHPYPGVLPGTTPPLAAVYLRQQTAPWTAQAAGNDPDSTDRGRQKRQEETGTRPAEQALAEQHACIVLAGPGGGKSSLLRTHLAHSAERRLADGGDAAVAVLVTAADLERLPLAPALASAVNTQLAPYGLTEELPAQLFHAPPHPGTHWLVLIDGLDELTDPAARHRVLRTVATLAESGHAGLYRFVVATRPLPGRELDTLDRQQWPRHELLPFTIQQLPDVAESWFHAAGMDNARGAAERFVQHLERTGLTGLARVPLMASMLCQLHATDPSRPLPQGRGRLYRDFINLLHKHQYAPGPAQARTRSCGGMERYGHNARQQAEHVLDHLHNLIAHLAAQRRNGNRLPTLDIVESRPEARCPARVPHDQWQDFLGTALRRSGLLTVRAGELIFLHQTLLEYLAARHVTRGPHTRADALRQALRRPHTDDRSYIGFLLDTAHEADPHAAAPYLYRLASRRAGLHGCEFIASQVHLGTLIPPHTVRATADLLHTLATATTLRGSARVDAARGLAGLGDPRAPDLFYTLATATTLDGSARVRAARELAGLGDPRAPDLFYTLATATTLRGSARVDAARGLAGLGDPRAPDLFY
ncbi:hypothetical protein ABZ657_27535, partial [Streptomyces sp. NPDC007000]